MRIIVDATGNALMWSELGQPTPNDGQTAIDLEPDLESAFVAALVTARYGLTFDGKNFTPIPPPPVPPVPAP